MERVLRDGTTVRSAGPGDLGRDEVRGFESPAEPVNLRKQCLETALKYTQVDRNRTHGSPENNFRNIAAYWNAHLEARYGQWDPPPLDATDVALMMLGMKAARLSFNPAHEDSWIDAAGYAACGMEIALSEGAD